MERVTFFDALLPTFTFPNDNETGEALRIPTGVDTPVPESATTVGELLRLLTTEADPFTVPVLVGENTTLVVKLVPAATVSGRVTPGTVNTDPVMFMALITRSAVPVFVMVTVFVLLLPTVALPNDTEFGETLADTIGPDPEPCGDTPVLPHPIMTGNANRTTMEQACATVIAIEFRVFVTVSFSPLPSSETEADRCNTASLTVSGGNCWFNLNGPLKRYERRPRIHVLLTML